MLFRINMYPAGRERRIEAEGRLRRSASLAVVIGVNAAIVILFVTGLRLADQAAAARQTRLAAAEGAVSEILAAQGGAMTREDLELVRKRAAQVRWSRVLESVARVTPREVVLSRLRLAEGTTPGSQTRVPGLRITGRLTAGSEQAGLAALMGFLGALRDDEYFAKHFHDPKLVDSTWLNEEGVSFLEFDAFCPAEDALQLSDAASASATPTPQPDEVEKVGPGEATTPGGTGGKHEGSL